MKVQQIIPDDNLLRVDIFGNVKNMVQGTGYRAEA